MLLHQNESKDLHFGALTFAANFRDTTLDVLGKAHQMSTDGRCETAIAIDQANCLLALDRYDDSYNAASRALNTSDEEMKTLAMQYMAECTMWGKDPGGHEDLFGYPQAPSLQAGLG